MNEEARSLRRSSRRVDFQALRESRRMLRMMALLILFLVLGVCIVFAVLLTLGG